jgi:hypothetical protein
MKMMKKRRIIPKLGYVNYRTAFPNLCDGVFNRWLSIHRYWGGRIVEVTVLHHQLSLDFRRNWVDDMINTNGG